MRAIIERIQFSYKLSWTPPNQSGLSTPLAPWRHFHFVLKHRDMDDIIKTEKKKINNFGYVKEQTQLCVMFSLGVFPFEMMSVIFISRHGNAQALFYLLKGWLWNKIFILFKFLFWIPCLMKHKVCTVWLQDVICCSRDMDFILWPRNDVEKVVCFLFSRWKGDSEAEFRHVEVRQL